MADRLCLLRSSRFAVIGGPHGIGISRFGRIAGQRSPSLIRNDPMLERDREPLLRSSDLAKPFPRHYCPWTVGASEAWHIGVFKLGPAAIQPRPLAAHVLACCQLRSRRKKKMGWMPRTLRLWSQTGAGTPGGPCRDRSVAARKVRQVRIAGDRSGHLSAP